LGEPSLAELNLVKIIEFLGGAAIPVRLTGEGASDRELLRNATSASRRLMISAGTLAKVSKSAEEDRECRRWLTSSGANLLVYGFEPTPEHSRVLGEWTSSSLLGVESSTTAGCQITVASSARQICRQFSGLSFGAKGAGEQMTFVQAHGEGPYVRLISLGEKPCFVRLKDQPCEILLLAGDAVADLDSKVRRGASLLEVFLTLAPALMFLRSSSPNEFWENDAPSACLVIDDPLLKSRYGFLEYGKLLEVMERARFCTSIAFIPWNFKRSDERLAGLFAANPQRYSLCVHGCDHTRGEFGVDDQALLRERAMQALERMSLHRKLSGIDFDDVMVFPQCIFSMAAMEAVKICGYLAVANSSEFAIDGADRLSLRDLLEVAVTRFSNVPLFIRRAARNIAELAFDLFLGKPALLVEHHGFFREGYDAVEETVEKVNSLDERLRWANLATVCSRASLKKTDANGKVHVRFFTDRFDLRNDTERAQTYRVHRRTTSPEAHATLALDGQCAETWEDSEGIKAEISLPAGQAGQIKVARLQGDPVSPRQRQNAMHDTKVFLRRSLSEFRDNYLQKSRF